MQDAYLQFLLSDQFNREVVKLRTEIYAMWAVVGGEAGKMAVGKTSEGMDEWQNLLFPGRSGRSDASRDKREIAFMEKMMARWGFGHLVKPKPKPPEPSEPEEPRRMSWWQQMLNRAKGE